MHITDQVTFCLTSRLHGNGRNTVVVPKFQNGAGQSIAP